MAQDQPTREEVILKRLADGKRFMQKHVYKAERTRNRYIDSSARTLLRAENESQSLPVGEINYLAMNVRQKVASTAYNIPDLHVVCSDEETGYSELVRKTIREDWRRKKWSRLFRRILTARFVEGLGFTAYLWDRKKGFQLEYVKAEEALYPPTTTDETWDNPQWAGRVVWMPVDTAFEKWGQEVFMQPQTAGPVEAIYSSEPYDIRNKERNSFPITVYWDEYTEATYFGNHLLQGGKNHYGRVPMRVLQGDINPSGEFPLSDYDTSMGIFEQLRRLLNVLNNIASNGGGILWMRAEYIDEKIREKVISGQWQGPIVVQGAPGEQAVGYTQGQQLSDALLEALKMLSQGLDADTGVTEYDRGVVQSNPKFATQAALLANRSGSRANLVRTEFEMFVDDLMQDYVKLTAQFGLDPGAGEPTDEAVSMWKAFASVQEVRVIEESLAFKDPAMLQQQNMQLFTTAQSSLEALGVFGVMPNLKRLFDDILRSFDRKQIEQYWTPLPEPAATPGEEAAEGEQDQAGGGGMAPVGSSPGAAPPDQGQGGQ